MTAETIDILLPHFGDVDYLRAAVESILDQSDENWRLVCVDDAAPSEEGHEWLSSLDDPRISSVRNERNLGVALNFSRCLELVEAEWFVMMGADDIMLPNYLATVRRALELGPIPDVVQPGVAVIDGEGALCSPLPDRVKRMLRPRLKGTHRDLVGSEMAESLTRADWAYFPSLLWRTESVRRHGFNAAYDVALDLALLLDIALDNGRMRLVDELCFQYRRHSRSFSQATAASGLRFEQERIFFTAYAQTFANRGWKRASRIARNRVVSRLNAATAVAGALTRRQGSQARGLVTYVVR